MDKEYFSGGVNSDLTNVPAKGRVARFVTHADGDYHYSVRIERIVDEKQPRLSGQKKKKP